MKKKACTQCGETKPLDEFYTNGKQTLASGKKVVRYRSECKECNRADVRRRRREEPEKYRASVRRSYHKRMQDPEKRKAERKRLREYNRWKRKNDPDFVRRERERMREKRKDPEYRRKERQRMRKLRKNPEYRKRRYEYQREYWKTYKVSPEKRAAVDAVQYAIQTSTLPHISAQACLVCGKEAKVYHHYLGYAKKHRLDVVPLCHRHHRMTHRKHKGDRINIMQYLS